MDLVLFLQGVFFCTRKNQKRGAVAKAVAAAAVPMGPPQGGVGATGPGTWDIYRDICIYLFSLRPLVDFVLVGLWMKVEAYGSVWLENDAT